MTVRPLTRSNTAGEIYQRTEPVLRQIESLSNTSGRELLARALVDDKDSSAYIQEETLVYWIREYQHQRDAQLAGELAVILLTRSTRFIQSKLRGLGQDNAQDAEQDAVNKLFVDIFNLDSNQSDFLQVRYWLVLDGIVTNIFKKYVRTLKRTEYLSSPEESDEFSSEDGVTARVGAYELVDTNVVVEQRALISEALALVDDPYRTAFVLYHNGWPIESKDTNAITISSYFKREPRTIRNWLRRVEQVLSAWKNEERL